MSVRAAWSGGRFPRSCSCCMRLRPEAHNNPVKRGWGGGWGVSAPAKGNTAYKARRTSPAIGWYLLPRMPCECSQLLPVGPGCQLRLAGFYDHCPYPPSHLIDPNIHGFCFSYRCFFMSPSISPETVKLWHENLKATMGSHGASLRLFVMR